MSKTWRGEWALVTGASSGIGKAIAQRLAAHGANLILTARRESRLLDLQRELAGVQVRTIAIDLEQPGAPRQLFSAVQQLGVQPGLLINNAGFGDYGEFHQLDLDRQLAMVEVNCSAVVGLTRLFLPAMIERRRGDILIVASTASFQAVPYQTTYAATKAFDLIFAEGLAEEVRQYGIRVCALCPGQTRTEFQEIAREPIPGAMSVHTADQVAKIGLEALAAGKHSVVCGTSNLLGMEFQRILPRRMVTAISERLFRPKK
jgi:short-subunit dehydrogenase